MVETHGTDEEIVNVVDINIYDTFIFYIYIRCFSVTEFKFLLTFIVRKSPYNRRYEGKEKSTDLLRDIKLSIRILQTPNPLVN